MAEGVVRGVAYRPRQRVLLAARLECRLAAGSRPRNGDERRSLALWAVREPTIHWGLCLFLSCRLSILNHSRASPTYSAIVVDQYRSQTLSDGIDASVSKVGWKRYAHSSERYLLLRR